MRFLAHKLAILVTAVVAMLASGTGCGQTQPAAQHRQRPAAIDAQEHAATIAALRPPKRQRPVVAVLGDNQGTETTDYLMPYGVLKQSGLAEVWALAIAPGLLPLHPALAIKPQATAAEFDARYPDGADYVIVPAMHHSGNPAVLAWIKAQAAKGAMIVGVCSGVRVLSKAGLLRERAATGFWYDLDDLRRENPSMRWVRDRRYVVDSGVATTTGITATIPASLAIVEAIGGKPAAAALARELGVESWDAAHDSDAFRLGRHFWTATGNMLAFWNHETVGIPVAEGVDEIALALTADIYSRTYRSHAFTLAERRDVLTTRRGIQLVPDQAAGNARVDLVLPAVSAERPTRALETALDDVAKRYGKRTAAIVALQLEYQR